MKRSNFLLAVVIALSLIVALQADVIVKQKMNVETGGFMNMETEATEYFKADRSCGRGATKVIGPMAAMMGEGAQTEYFQITRLDKGVMWNITADEKTYSETRMASLKEKMTGGESDAGKLTGDPSEYEWTVEVTASDDKADINDFKCKNVIGKASGVHKEDPEKKMLLIYEYWYAEDFSGFDELMEFGKNFSKATGVDVSLGREATRAIFSEFGAQFDEMTDKMVEAGGYPIKTVIKVESTEGAAKVDQMPPEMKAMMGITDEAIGEGGMMTVFSLASEIQSIEKKSIDDSKFEIPEGFEKK